MTTNQTTTFGDKLKALLGSVRFWIVTLTAIVAILEATSSGLGLPDILEIVKYWLITVAGIGTVDSVARKIGGSDKPVDTSTEDIIALLKASK